MPGRRKSALSPEERLDRKRLFARLRQQRCRQRKRRAKISKETTAPNDAKDREYQPAVTQKLKAIISDTPCVAASNFHGTMAAFSAPSVAKGDGKSTILLKVPPKHLTPILPAAFPNSKIASPPHIGLNYADTRGPTDAGKTADVLGDLAGRPLHRAPMFVMGVPVPSHEETPHQGSSFGPIYTSYNEVRVGDSASRSSHYNESYAIAKFAKAHTGGRRSPFHTGGVSTIGVSGGSSIGTAVATVSPTASPVSCVPVISRHQDNVSPVSIRQVHFVSSSTPPEQEHRASLQMYKPKPTRPFAREELVSETFRASSTCMAKNASYCDEEQKDGKTQKHLPPRKRMLLHRRTASEAAKQIEAVNAILSLSEVSTPKDAR